MNSRTIYLLALGLSCLCIHTNAQERSEITGEQIATWIRQLDSDSSSQREAATKALVNAGAPACELVLQTYFDENTSVEARFRCVAIMEAWLREGDSATSGQIRTFLKNANAGRDEALLQVLVRLQADIDRITRAAEQETIQQLNDLGAVIGHGGIPLTGVAEYGYSLYLGDWKGSPQEFQSIRKIRTPLFVVGQGRIDAELLSSLVHTNVRYLWIKHEITDEMAELLGRMQTLEDLHMGQAKFGASAVEAVGHLAHLKRLELGYEMNEDWFPLLGNLPRLERLECGSAICITGKGLKELGEISTLKEIGLGRTSVQGSELRHLLANPQLEVVSTPSRYMSDEGLEILSKMPNLKVLRMGGMVSARGMSHLKKCESLEELTFGAIALPTKQMLAAIAAIPNLKKVSIGSSFLTPEMIAALDQSRSLEEISISDSPIKSSIVDELSLRTQNRKWEIRDSMEPSPAIQVRAKKLIELGVGVYSTRFRPDEFVIVYIVREQFNGTAQDLGLLRDMKCGTVVLDIPIDDETVDQILFGPDIRELVVSDVIRHDLFVRLSQRFPKVVLRQSSWN